MEIKRYSKKELACRYFPDASEPKVALNHLRSWINGCPELVEQLGRVRLHRTRNHYNEEEVALIVDYPASRRTTDRETERSGMKRYEEA